MKFGEKLKELRKEKGISQKDLATALGVTQRTISYYENNNTPPTNAEIVSRIAEILNIKLDELIDNQEDTKIHKLIKKLKYDTDKDLIHWQFFETAYEEKQSDTNYFYTVQYKQIFNQQNFPQYSEAELDIKNSYFYSYKNGGYLVAKFLKDNIVEYALFILVNDENYILLTNNNSIVALEDLYLSISNKESSVNILIDDYLNQDFEKEETPYKQNSNLDDEEIHF